MGEKIQKLLNKLKEWWDEFNVKQKTIIASVITAVLIAFIILGTVLSKPNLILLAQCETTKEASEIKDLLDEEKISSTISNDGLKISVNVKDQSTAELLLGKNGIPTVGYDLESVFEGGFSSTEADRTKKYQLYLEEKIASELMNAIGTIEDANVNLRMPEKDGTILSRGEESYVSVLLTLSGKLEEDAAAGIAQYVATAVGNATTQNVTILDSNSSVLFAGGEASSATGIANSQFVTKSKLESNYKSQVKDIMIGTSIYDNVAIGLNLVVDFNQEHVIDRKYNTQNGNDQGYKDTESLYESLTEGGGSAAVPGTDANDDTTYVIEDNGDSSSEVSDRTTDYALDEKVTTTDKAIGVVIPEESSITVVANTYKIYSEDELREEGQLDGTTFDAFIKENGLKTKLEVDEEFYGMVSKATGIAEENISIVAYEVPFIKYSSGSDRTWGDYAQIALVVLILALLGFVVFKSTRSTEVVELEPELSVEALLETTKSAQAEELENIGFNEKSEIRLLIEKFVDENPDAVASLLRNWLNEDWE